LVESSPETKAAASDLLMSVTKNTKPDQPAQTMSAIDKKIKELEQKNK